MSATVTFTRDELDELKEQLQAILDRLDALDVQLDAIVDDRVRARLEAEDA